MSTPLDRDMVILNPATDNYISLDPIGRRIWELLAAPAAVRDLCQRMSVEYRGNAGDIQADMLAFLNELAAEGVVDVAEA